MVLLYEYITGCARPYSLLGSQVRSVKEREAFSRVPNDQFFRDKIAGTQGGSPWAHSGWLPQAITEDSQTRDEPKTSHHMFKIHYFSPRRFQISPFQWITTPSYLAYRFLNCPKYGVLRLITEYSYVPVLRPMPTRFR